MRLVQNVSEITFVICPVCGRHGYFEISFTSLGAFLKHSSREVWSREVAYGQIRFLRDEELITPETAQQLTFVVSLAPNLCESWAQGEQWRLLVEEEKTAALFALGVGRLQVSSDLW